MRRLLLPLALLATAGLLVPLDVRHAYACSCAELDAQQAVDSADAILVGDLMSWVETPSRLVKEGNAYYEYGHLTEATIHVDRYLKGRGPSTLEVVGGTCIGVISRERIGETYLLFLWFDWRYEHGLATDGCAGSGPVSVTSGPNCLGPTTPTQEGCIGRVTVPHPLLAEVDRITGPGEPPDDSLSLPPEAGAFPSLPAAALAVLGPLAFLAGAAFVWRRGESHGG